ncbi:MAG TPA: metal ABC transporter ATP-binding protein [Candidatus Anoxymicrobiaceae bacterium]|jgi:zinc transport system ATP-binding protein
MTHACKVAEFFDGTGGPRTLIQLDNVWVSLGGQTVLENISFTLQEKSFVGVIGPNGAGKTTLLRLILGILKPERGDVCVMGMSPTELRHELHHIGYVPQNVLFDPLFPVTVFDVVMMGRICCIGPLRFARKKDRDAVLESIRMVGLHGLEKRLIGELSGGQQKRAFLARALCRETHILLLDEPTSGLDVPAQNQFMELLTRLKEELGLSVIFVSHDVNVLARYADEVICINRTMHMHGKPEEVLGSDRLKDVYRCEFDFLVGAGDHAHGESGGAG